MPGSFNIHPILNIAHLELYQESPAEFGKRPTKNLNRADFNDIPEDEADRIVGESWRKGRKGRRIPIFRVRWVGYPPDADTWEPEEHLKNAHAALQEWKMNERGLRSKEATRLEQ